MKVYTITDRPVYRPGSPVRFKFWVARARYDQPVASEFAGQTFAVEIQNPKGDKVFAKTFKADAFGGFDGSFELPSDAMLGVYQVFIPRAWRRLVPGRGVQEARVRGERRGPEDAGDARRESLGDHQREVLLRRTGRRGEGQVQDHPHDGRRALVSRRPMGLAVRLGLLVVRRRFLVVSRLVAVGHAPAHSCVVGASRRRLPKWWPRPSCRSGPMGRSPSRSTPRWPRQPTRIRTSGTRSRPRSPTSPAARSSARGPCWSAQALQRLYLGRSRPLPRGRHDRGRSPRQTLAHKPVAGKGTLKLLKIAYDAERKPVETPVESWDLTLDADGQARQTIKASAPGQYRLSSTIDDGHGHAIEGGYLLTITGQGFDGASFRFNDLEIIPEKKEYRPGETLRLLINTNQVNSTVLLFVRPTNSVYLPPKVVHLRGKSTVEEIGIVPGDMPNIFVEALTVADGKVHDEAREIAIPPESRVVDVAVEPSQKTYKPGQKAKVKVKITGPDKKPFVGSTVVAVYDKAVEYISGGSNVPDIKEVFWKWKRSHYPQTESSLDRWSANLTRPNEMPMQDLGAFGDLISRTVAATVRRTGW